MREAAGQRVSEVASAISAFSEEISDYPRLIETIVRSTARLCGGFCAIGLVSPDGVWLERAAMYDDDSEARALIEELALFGRVPLVSNAPASEVIRTGKPFMTPAITTELLRTRFPEASWPLLDRLAIKSLMQVPLRNQGKVIGVLTLNRHGRTATAFDEIDLDIAQHVADHAALSLVNARRFELAQRINRRLRLATEAAQEFSEATSDLKGLLDVIARRLSEVLGDLCALRLISEDGEWLDLRATSIAGRPGLRELAEAAHEVSRSHIGEGVSGRIVATGQPILVQRADVVALIASLSPERRSLMQGLDISSIIGAPLLVRGKVIGTVLSVRSGSESPYSAEDLQLLQDLAAYAALAISNGQLLESARSELAERKRAEAALVLVEDQLRQAQKMEAVGKLAGGIAHDFNNVLSVILSYSALLVDQFEPLDARCLDLQEIRRAAERAAGLTRQLLAFSRQQVPSPSLVNLNGLIGGLRRMFETLTGERLTLHLVLAPELWQVKADPGHLEQVLMNLVVNAGDAMQHGGALTIETANVELGQDYADQHLGVVPGPHVMFAVSDTGIGMDRATQARIFEPFFTTKAVGKGTGLGLSTTFGIVKQHRGSIWVYSELERGTTFKVYLPRSVEESPPAHSSASPPPARLSGNETVLLVEDEEQVRTVARMILETNGYRVLEANTAEAALEVCSRYEGDVHLLFTDVVMPGLGGRALAERLSERRPHLRVLYTSGYTENAIVHHQMFDGSLALLQKPFTPELLLRKIREVLG